MQKKIGIIGYGNMGFVIGERLKSHPEKYDLFVYDKDAKKVDGIVGIKSVRDAVEAVGNSDAVILAVKPQDFGTLLVQIKDSVKEKLVISIAAGIPTACLEKALGKIRVIRIMPNLPARIGKGISCICAGQYVTEFDVQAAVDLFENLGATIIIDEKLMNAATAISGSGPGYLYDMMIRKNLTHKNTLELQRFCREEFIPLLREAAGEIGFSVQQAGLLSESTVKGSIGLLEITNLHPQELLPQIVSKGGTTEAALAVLRRTGSLRDAVKAAVGRAEELAKQMALVGLDG